MAGSGERFRSDVNFEAELQYAEHSLNADSRRRLYDYADPPRNIWQEALDAIELRGDEWMLDVGTGSGHFLHLLADRLKQQFPSGFDGSVLGIDKYASNFMFVWQMFSRLDPIGPIGFSPGDAERLHFPESSIDVLTAMFLLYHVQDPVKALESFKRVVKPGGQIIIATRGEDNQDRLWELGAMAAEKFGADAPESFYNHFSIDMAAQVLPTMFEVEAVVEQDSYLKIPIDNNPDDMDGWRDFRQALFTLKDITFFRDPSGERLTEENILHETILKRPRGRDYKSFVDNEAWQIFSSEAAQNGYFKMKAHQAFFVCRNNK